jgi:hypothetical protein
VHACPYPGITSGKEGVRACGSGPEPGGLLASRCQAGSRTYEVPRLLFSPLVCSTPESAGCDCDCDLGINVDVVCTRIPRLHSYYMVLTGSNAMRLISSCLKCAMALHIAHKPQHLFVYPLLSLSTQRYQNLALPSPIGYNGRSAALEVSRRVLGSPTYSQTPHYAITQALRGPSNNSSRPPARLSNMFQGV